MEGFEGFQKYFQGGGLGEPTFVFEFVFVLAHEQPIIDSTWWRVRTWASSSLPGLDHQCISVLACSL